ncbi:MULTISPECIES: response regulator [unclassified Paenibacillus]|uniref:response regulator transcription factor n=1 Tax=unclassified Paenibacillus TaxID=185978 RepID=UPI00240514B5|nr:MULTISPECIES: response regulator [unclassified Paenibacillus]MDF9843160.1 two-component system response regulator YesN [Paenibacillus sp. PastF-2]MDF9849628.1 two-component system response regulator YesN [Paenibacillus sp. PastM-2]MDF9856455.1 two-component system response regulator YesN [Paenibacillus sp. PastF-1]MDH6481726.1 two-component system response regulator YesN [Paenibacillus sp. PastH-2]MDH6509007.1 two-component system response regulator YesN [Paenibacillus sp. PastM-3]
MYRVLIVDDDRLARQGIISIMEWEKYGMSVVGEAQNGEKAMELLAATPVDLLFVDLDMPVMNGISLMEKCRELYPKLLFVVLTFYEEFKYVQTALRMGAIDYISKLQMESTDCNELLKEISNKVEGRMKQSRVRSGNELNNGSPHGSGEDSGNPSKDYMEQEWEQLVSKWRQMYWLYDDLNFEELCRRTKELHIPIWKVAQVLLYLTSVAEENIGIVQKDIQQYENLEAFFEWMSSFRQALYKKAFEEINHDKMHLCVMKAVIFIKNHLATKMHGEDVAQSVNLSRSYFSVNFKKYTGLSFNEFIRKERVRAAKRLLEEKDKLVSDIAQMVGYDDVNYFIRVFCDETGMTPGEYRKRKAKE